VGTEQIDEIRLQRLVDGALNDEERREFLAGLDSTPELWREVALAFVEDQIFCSELGVPRETRGRTGVTTAQPTSSVSRAGMLAVALSLLAFFGVGYFWGQWRVASPVPAELPRVANVSETDSEAADVEVADDESQTRESAYRLLLAHQDGKTIELPVYERSQPTDFPWDPVEMGKLQRLNEILVQRGYRADMRTEYLSGQLDDGRQIVVPWRTVSLEYDAQ
jgi:hypothetical protein